MAMALAVPGQRVTDAVQTDLTQHLALPVTYAPDQCGSVYSNLAAKDIPLSNNRAAVQQAVQLLGGADLSYLYVPTFHCLSL